MAPIFQSSVPAALPQHPKVEAPEQTPRAKSHPSSQICLDYIKGQCVGRRTQCRFLHPDLTEFNRLCAAMPPGCTVCEVFVLTGQCKFGPKCSKVHPIFVKVGDSPPATPQRPPVHPQQLPASPQQTPATPRQMSMSPSHFPASPQLPPPSPLHFPASPQHPIMVFPQPVVSFQPPPSPPSANFAHQLPPRAPARALTPEVGQPLGASFVEEDDDVVDEIFDDTSAAIQDSFADKMKGCSGLLKGISFDQLLKDLCCDLVFC